MENATKVDTVKIHDLHFKIMLPEQEIAERIEALGKEITQQFKGKTPILLGILNGSFMFMSDLSRACHMDCESTFVKLSSYAGTSSTGKVKTMIGMESGLKGRDIVIVEDIIDTAETLHYFLPQLQAMEPASISIAALLVKREAMKYDLPIDFVGFEIPPKFVVGYGLDYNQLGRNLKSIYQLIEDE